MRLLLLLAVFASSVAEAATISSTTCTPSDSSGCITAYAPSSVAVTFQVSGTWEGTIEFEGSNGGEDYVAIRAYPVGGGLFVNSTRGNGAWTVPTGGFAYVRARASQWTSGVATVMPRESASPVSVDVVRATGTNTEEVPISGTVGLNQQSLNAIIGPTCVPSDIRRIAITGTPLLVPVISPTRTEVTIHNMSDGSKSVTCRPDVSGLGDLPDCTTPGYGLTIAPEASVTFSFRASISIRCRVCPAGNGVIEHMELSCTG